MEDLTQSEEETLAESEDEGRAADEDVGVARGRLDQQETLPGLTDPLVRYAL